MKKFIAGTFLFLLFGSTEAQKYISEKSLVTFFSDARVEDIYAVNKNASGIIDISSMQLAFSVPIIDFKFEKKLMQEHFNEKYMETEKYPKSVFQGQVIGFNQAIKGQQKVKAKGKLTIHGVTNEVEIPGTIEVTPDNKLNIKSTFMVKLKDYKITIPQLLWQNVAEEVEVKIDFGLKAKS